MRPDLDPEDVTLVRAGLWQLDPAREWKAQAQRIYEIVLSGVQRTTRQAWKGYVGRPLCWIVTPALLGEPDSTSAVPPNLPQPERHAAEGGRGLIADALIVDVDDA